jgi:hypothetical protein
MATNTNCPPSTPVNKRTGYRRSWTDADRAVNHLTGDPVQPANAIVTQKVSGIEYNVWNGDYQRSFTIPVSNTGDQTIDPPLNKDPVQPDILSGWNNDYVKQVWWDRDAKTYEFEVEDLSQQYVEQTLYRAFYIDEEKEFNEDNEYVARDICNNEIDVIEVNGILIPVGDAVLCLEDDRDNTFKTEFSFQAIQLEDNTELSHIDYTGDYFVREEGDIALSFEQGGLIEPYGLY